MKVEVQDTGFNPTAEVNGNTAVEAIASFEGEPAALVLTLPTIRKPSPHYDHPDYRSDQ